MCWCGGGVVVVGVCAWGVCIRGVTGLIQETRNDHELT